MEFRDALKCLRGELALTQTELATALHINYATVSRWELGKTLPNRSTVTLLTEYAESHSASKKCIDMLKRSIADAAKGRLDISGSSLYTAEYASLCGIIDDALFPIYVCDAKTHELLYVNRRAGEITGGRDYPNGTTCYECLMHRSSPCPSCHVKELVSARFTAFDVCSQENDNVPEQGKINVQGKLIRWNGHDAVIWYITAGLNGIANGATQLAKEREAAYNEQLSIRKQLAEEATFSAHFNLTENTVSEVRCTSEVMRKLIEVKSPDEILADLSKSTFVPEERNKFDEICSRNAMTRLFYKGTTHISVKHYLANHVGYYESTFDLMHNPLTHELEAYVYMRDITEETLANEIVSVLLNLDYETITTINADTGEAHPFTDGKRIKNVIALQKELGDNSAGVKAYLQKYCIDDDVDRVIKETSLPYVKEQLELKDVFTTSYSLNMGGVIVHKRVLYAYIGKTKRTILCAMQNLTDTYRRDVIQRDRLSSAMEAIQEVSDMNVARYDLKTKTFYSNSNLTLDIGYSEVVENVPDEFINSGHVSPESIIEFKEFYEKLRLGEVTSITPLLEAKGGAFHCFRVNAKLIYGEDGKPYQAIIVFQDVEEQREQVAVYKKWRQSLERKKDDDYTLFRCNLSKGASFDKKEGNLLRIYFDPDLKTFNERTREYASRFVHPDDYDEYTKLLNSENLLASYYRGTRAATMNYREIVSENDYRWLSLSVEMAQYPYSNDIEVFMMYEKSGFSDALDKTVKKRLESDPLTGILNRSAFIEQFTSLIATGKDERHALILADIDGFKQINENFGHAVGDQALIDIAASISSVVRENDLVGRLGGDKFMICLKNIPNQAVVEKKAMQILGLLRKVFSLDVILSGSLGISIYPKDGKNFNDLYRSVDMALYTAKANGCDTFAFFGGTMPTKRGNVKNEAVAKSGGTRNRTPRALIVDNDIENIKRITNFLGDEYRIEVRCDDRDTMSYLRRFGVSISFVLMSLYIPGLDAFTLLDRIRRAREIGNVPVIVMGKTDERKMCLLAIEHGATDFVLAPVEAGILKNRIEAAISKAENERLRAQNSYLQARSTEGSGLRTVFENTGTVVVEYDWENHVFTYDPAISEHIAGKYDNRSLWQIFLSDYIADAMDVKTLQKLIYDLANSQSRASESIDILLRIPSGIKHWFAVNAFKRVNDVNLTSKVIITFLDVNDDILASKKLRFQAEHDSLTGLYNRAAFLKMVEESVAEKPACSYVLLCCNINDFRFINERCGHEEGDKLLQYAAERMLVYSKKKGGFAGRLGNDVFSILVPNTEGVIERATEVVKNFFNDYPLSIKITGRAGAYIISDTTIKAYSMLDMASIAVSTIRGKFSVWLAVYDDSMSEKFLREKSITDRMEAALAAGQFDVYFQPQFHHATKKIVGTEALVRWIDPINGVISPTEFIPIFEKNGFISKLDEYVWEKTAKYLRTWMEKGNEIVPVSVNVSREDIGNPQMCERLLEIIDKYSIPIRYFRLEITESLFAEDIHKLIAVLDRLHEAGFLIEMDDFGSGYSSLNILKDVEVDILKLDMKFFSGCANPGRGGMIINAVMRMARWLNIPVIAEGVEEAEQADFLLSVGCPTIQGFLYAKPMPSSEIERMLLGDVTNTSIYQNTIEAEPDIHNFWNHESADSRIFNNYIGPAAIFEYHAGGYELVRMNKRFITLFEIDGSESAMMHNVFKLCDEDCEKFKRAVVCAIESESGEDVKTDIGCILNDGSCPHFRLTLRVIAKSDNRALIFGTFEK